MVGNPQTEKGSPIHYVAEGGSRTEIDGTEKRVHLGYSQEGFHSAVETTRAGQETVKPYQWGKPHPTIYAATEAAWHEVFKTDAKEQVMAEIPDHVKAQADAAVAETGQKEKFPVQNMDAPQPVDNYGDRGKELEAMREQKRQELAQEKATEPTQPDKQ